MKYIIIVFILLSMHTYSQDSCDVIGMQSFCCKLDSEGRKQGLWKYYQSPNCILQSEIMYKDDYRDGKSIVYYLDGKIMTESYYKNDTLNGLSRTYRRDGSLYRELNYKMGIVNGLSKYFDSSGRTVTISDFKDGKRNGYMKLYYPNGMVEEEIYFIGGMKDGSNKLFNSNGNLIREFIWKNDHIIIERYYCSGILVKEFVKGKGDWE